MSQSHMTFAIINKTPYTQLSAANKAALFTGVHEEEATVRWNLAGTKLVLKYTTANGTPPQWVALGPVEYDHAGILAVLAGPEWTEEITP